MGTDVVLAAILAAPGHRAILWGASCRPRRDAPPETPARRTRSCAGPKSRAIRQPCRPDRQPLNPADRVAGPSRPDSRCRA